MSPEPTTAHTRRPTTAPVRAVNSRTIAVASRTPRAASASLGQTGQQRRLGLADGVDGVVMPHQSQDSMPRRTALRSLRIRLDRVPRVASVK
ncbi:hypothetical protein I552_8842 [Mycobacterium xenopi 3993]|nr:hypothetical protein I552_8842 [Mycobacterium xenopi 3993]